MSHQDDFNMNDELCRVLFESAPDGIFIIDRNNSVIEINSRVHEMMGYTREDLLGSSMSDLFHPDDTQSPIDFFNEPLPPKQSFHQYRMRCKDGCYVHVETYFQPLSDQWIAINIRELIRRDQIAVLLRESEEKFRLIAEKTTDVIWLMDLTGKSLFVSPSVEKFTGFTVPEYLQQTIDNRFTPESAALAKRLFAEKISQYLKNQSQLNGASYTLELEYVCKDGGTKWGELIITPYFLDQHDFVGIHGVTRDVTQRKLTELALRKSEEKFRLLSENATDVIWTFDLESEKFTYFSPSVQLTRGYTPAEAMQISLKDTLVPESYDRAMVQLKEGLQRETQTGMDPDRYRLMEFEEICKNGSTIITEAKVKFTRNSAGKAIGIIGISRDITDRKKAEAEREKLILELENALDQVKRLSGLLPICASCKKIRNDEGYWQDVAVYIHNHSEAEFSHGLCPDCIQKYYRDLLESVD